MTEKKRPRQAAKKVVRRAPSKRPPQRKVVRPTPLPHSPRKEPIVITKRQALPWLVSLGFHGLLLLASLVIVVSRAPGLLPVQPFEVSLGSGIGVASGEGDGGSPAADLPRPARARVPLPARSTAHVPLPTRPAAVASARPRLAPIMAEASPAARGAQAQPDADPVRPSVPTAQAVLGDLPSASGGDEASAEYGWEGGAPRAVLVRKEPRFPPALSAEGQEAECVARITVAPAGNVTRVEIVRGSGYTEIDASVEAALREFLFSRVEGRKDAVGTITFRFRLEKRD